MCSELRAKSAMFFPCYSKGHTREAAVPLNSVPAPVSVSTLLTDVTAFLWCGRLALNGISRTFQISKTIYSSMTSFPYKLTSMFALHGRLKWKFLVYVPQRLTLIKRVHLNESTMQLDRTSNTCINSNTQTVGYLRSDI